jgi:4-amino-4-deoxychorismate lyase
MTILVNGRAADTLTVADRGLHYGDGLFETVAVQRGEPRLWNRHMQRLSEGCRRLGLPAPDIAVLRAETRRVAGESERAAVKIILTRGQAGRGYRTKGPVVPTRIVLPRPWPEYPPEWARHGVAVRWCETRLARQPRLAGLKHLNRLEQVLARAEWHDEVAEGLMRDAEGSVIEGTMSNLFVVRAGTLVTPDLSQSGVAGVMRAEVLERAAALGIPCRVETVGVAAVEAAEALFLTNSLIGIWPVQRLESRVYEVGQITQALQQALFGAG